MPIRRNWSYWLAVAIALAVLAYLTWQALTEPSSIPDKAKEQLREKQGILESAYLAAAYPPIPSQDLESRAVLAEAKTQLRVRLGGEMIAHHPVLDSHGSPVWKGNAGYSKLGSWGCQGVSHDCVISARDVKGGEIEVGGIMYDTQTDNMRGCRDERFPIDAYPCVKHWESNPDRNAEYHVTFTRNEVKSPNKYWYSRKSWHN